MKAPCKDCPDRYVDCHSRCKKYLAYAAEREMIREALHKESIANGSSPAKDKAYKIVYGLIRQGKYGKQNKPPRFRGG